MKGRPSRPGGSAVRAALAEAVYDCLQSFGKDRVGLLGLYTRLIEIDPPWRRRWTKRMIHRALDDLAAGGRVRLESFPEGKFVAVVLVDCDPTRGRGPKGH
jgi:hypothetical protein